MLGRSTLGYHIVKTLLADTMGQRIARPIPLTCARISVLGVVETHADDERPTCAVRCGSTPLGTIERTARKIFRDVGYRRTAGSGFPSP